MVLIVNDFVLSDGIHPSGTKQRNQQADLQKFQQHIDDVMTGRFQRNVTEQQCSTPIHCRKHPTGLHNQHDQQTCHYNNTLNLNTIDANKTQYCYQQKTTPLHPVPSRIPRAPSPLEFPRWKVCVVVRCAPHGRGG